ncbi:hypothetical protein B9Z65_891 [Elsinoe australis]|uniref:Uncharacterized protein n=1 Tax=Elsinoe australis TaxID=40998 RepID=A0A2P8AJW8_9PEZI|nr:hypothetical protein B9Z65_891 [Elsinoe australis]
MGVFYEYLSPSLTAWILEQHIFWVASAPLSGSGHVNVSPKGGKYFGVDDKKTFWYQDLTGSGNETISHIHEPGNGRIVILFNAFIGPPKIVRLWGHGRVLENGSPEFEAFTKSHADIDLIPGTRSIIMVDIHQVGTSCGFSVPYYDFKEYRPILNDFFANKEKKFKAGNASESMDRYWAYKNAWSMDGMPGMKRGLAAGEAEKVVPIKKMVGPLAASPGQYKTSSPRSFSLEHILLVALTCFVLGVLSALHGPDLVKNLPIGTQQRQVLWRR